MIDGSHRHISGDRVQLGQRRYVEPPWAAVAHLPDLHGVVAESTKNAIG
jgi:hypothetical protein